ncbi:MAG: hypothetical protein JWQ43_3839 [Glaciihabitans sp.]|nr:hypothetical protein [Glaciihabitans sp.]
MIALSALGLAAGVALTTTPVPMPAYEGDPNLITPGVFGFIAIFLVALATVFLLLDMNRRVRRTNYREMARQQIAAEQAAGLEQSDAPGAPPKVD